jgi:hypothetical protein
LVEDVPKVVELERVVVSEVLEQGEEDQGDGLEQNLAVPRHLHRVQNLARVRRLRRHQLPARWETKNTK